jgi:hypothetical protein
MLSWLADPFDGGFGKLLFDFLRQLLGGTPVKVAVIAVRDVVNVSKRPDQQRPQPVNFGYRVAQLACSELRVPCQELGFKLAALFRQLLNLGGGFTGNPFCRVEPTR